jgi:hypothetical protein
MKPSRPAAATLHRRTSLFSALFIATLTAAAFSQPAPLGELELEWVAPSECPTGDQVLEDARGLVTGEHQASPAERLTVHALVQPTADNRWRLTLSVGSSKRQVEAASCAELGRAAALFLALLVDPLRRAPPPALPSAAPRPAVPWALGLGAGLDHGTLDAPTVLAALGASLSIGRWEVNARGSLGPTQTRRLDSGVGAKLMPGIGMLESCYALPLGSSLRLGPCLGAEVGVLRGRAVGVDHRRSGYWPWLGLDGALAFTVGVGRHLELRADAGGALPLYRPAFRVASQKVAEPGPALRAGVLVLYRF